MHLTDAETQALVDRLNAEGWTVDEVRQAMADGYRQAEQAARERERAEALARAEATSRSDREIALWALRERGLSELDAYRKLERQPEILDELRPQIEQRKATLANLDSERQRTAFEASPEGRRLAAAEALEQEQRQQEFVEAGLALLRRDPAAHGISSDLIAGLAPDQVLALTGLAQDGPDSAHDHAANLARANPTSEGDQ